jgi:pyrroline-5-carboxylate reductase
MKISIIGTGNLGTSIAKGLLANDMFTSLYLTKKNISSLMNGKIFLAFL